MQSEYMYDKIDDVSNIIVLTVLLNNVKLLRAFFVQCVRVLLAIIKPINTGRIHYNDIHIDLHATYILTYVHEG